MVQKIVEYANQFIEKVAHSYKDKYDVRYTDITEIKALIGLLYLAGVHKGGRTTIYELWATDGTGLEIYVDTREKRKKTDNLAPIRELFEEVNGKFRNHYSPGEYVTIDEMLSAFRGRCAFRMYIPNKPARYGIRIYSLVDDRMYYTFNMEVYIGTQPAGPYQVSNKSLDVVVRMTEPIHDSKRNITMDNWFTSIPLAQSLLTDQK
nr:uncharacterized protein LOC111512584 [Leptinotarsa decemlineata]